jgi:hypothetical protein
MFEGDSADTGAGKFPLVSMGGRAEGLACADPGARTLIGASGIWIRSNQWLMRYSYFLNVFRSSFIGSFVHVKFPRYSYLFIFIFEVIFNNNNTESHNEEKCQK